MISSKIDKYLIHFKIIYILFIQRALIEGQMDIEAVLIVSRVKFLSEL